VSWLGGIRGRVTLTVLVVAACLYSLLATIGFLQIADGGRNAIRERIGEVLDQLDAGLRRDGTTLQITTPDGVDAIATSAATKLAVAPPGELRVVRATKIGGTDLLLVGRASEVRLTDSLRSFHRVLWTGVSIAALVTAVVAGLATGRALRPVKGITDLVGTVGPDDHTTRVTVPETGDEIEHLATTVNSMLDRIAAGRLAQRRFTSDAAHELRTPLMALQAEIELADGAAPLPDPLFLARIGELAERLGRRVDDLVLLSTLDETPPLSRHVCDLVELARHEAEGTGRPVEVVGDPVAVGLDERLAGRAIRNLLANAARHASDRVRVVVEPAGDDVWLHVDDDGPGIAPDERGRVFERFARLDEARSTDSGGAGLGLAIVASVARAHGGDVAARASDLGGARVSIRLPRAGTRTTEADPVA